MTDETRKCSGRLSIIERYRDLLSVDSQTPIVSLQEGDTPLLRAMNLERQFEKLTGSPAEFQLWLKYDGANPTSDLTEPTYSDTQKSSGESKKIKTEPSVVQ